ncbi:metal ABC transporter substrate-binding protein [Actinacidiphila glaucinigra]|uniref:metal ABC transporter substrate-binding protein n=1 Tax=Actinacidiphila glaucinigra TaxID=235986 RepID=UPI003D8F75BA
MNIGRALVPLAAAGLVALSACSTAGAGGEDGRLKVTASFYPMQFLAEQIGGGHVDVTELTKPGTEPHDLELTPRQTGELGESDVVVYLKGLQPAVDDAIAQSGVENTVDAAALTPLEDHGTEVDGHDHGSGDDHSGHGDEDAGADPHIWLDPVRYAEVAEGVGKALAKADPAHEAAYEKNTAALVRKLDTLDTDFQDGLKNRSSDTFITTHAAFGYLAERYGLVEQAISGIDPESEPSAARMRTLHTLAEDKGVSTVFFETLASDRTARTLAGDLGLKTAVLDPIEGITDKSAGRDYFEVQHSNLQALRAALGAK